MKKLRLNLEQLNNVRVLTRSQLKNVLGGSGGGTTEPGGGGQTTASPIECTITNTQSDGSSTVYTATYDSSTSNCAGIEGNGANSIGSIADGYQVQLGGSTHYTCPACN